MFLSLNFIYLFAGACNLKNLWTILPQTMLNTVLRKFYQISKPNLCINVLLIKFNYYKLIILSVFFTLFFFFTRIKGADYI